MYECDICKAKFNDHTSLSNHIFSAHGNNVNWNSRMPVMGGHRKPGMSNGQRLVAAFAGVLFAASLFVAPVKAQNAPQPTPSVGEPPHAIEMHRVYLPLIQFSAEVHGCDDCQAVNWNSGKVA